MSYLPIIGMEIHVELATASKMFCGCRNDPFNAPIPNIYTCPVCLAMPGGLPVVNRKAVEWTIKLGLALGCTIPLFSKFDRKHYFYPDLPKGYQISQNDKPLCKKGIIKLDEGDVRIQRVHLEEDTGKLIHSEVNGEKMTLVDFNRGGVPLVEIVTEPDVHSAQQAKAFLKKLHQIIRYLDISGADMEKGSMRLEPNISVREILISKSKIQNNVQISKDELPKYKVEVKNINSFNFVKKAIEYEIERQTEILEQGKTPVQETRGYVQSNGSTISQRTKENAEDYRYFPDPDIPPMRFTKEQIAAIKDQLPELPDAKIKRFQKEYGLSSVDAEQLAETREKAQYFENCIAYILSHKDYEMITAKSLANTIINKRIEYESLTPEECVKSIAEGIANNSVDEALFQKVITDVVSENPKAIADYQAGKTGVLMFLVGQVKKALQGKGDAGLIIEELEKRLCS